ncbi:MAG: hypothetical protein C4287_14825, partial [Leptolyngbya sp. ERB_1_2]
MHQLRLNVASVQTSLHFEDVMFKLISCIVIGAVVLAPLSPAHAGFRSSGFGVSIGSPSFGVSIGTPYGRNYRPYRNQVILRRSFYDPYRPYYPGVYSPGFYSPNFPGSRVIVVPRTVIVNPDDNNYPGYNNYNRTYCGSVIYGSP